MAGALSMAEAKKELNTCMNFHAKTVTSVFTDGCRSHRYYWLEMAREADELQSAFSPCQELVDTKESLVIQSAKDCKRS